MSHKPIEIANFSCIVENQILFDDFSTIIYPGSRIAIIGRNGVGKTCLLNKLRGELKDITTGYVGQIINDNPILSGGERFNKSLSEALRNNPDILLLDEPTNHLDEKNRSSLFKMIKHFQGTIIAISHDHEFLENYVDIIWHIHNQQIQIFAGNYKDYISNQALEHSQINKELKLLNRSKKEMHEKLMNEQKRAANSKKKGSKNIDNRKWPTVVSHAKASRAQETSGKLKKELSQKKGQILDRMNAINISEEITPSFHLEGIVRTGEIIHIKNASISYDNGAKILHNIDFAQVSGTKIALIGANGSGKSTFIKAILDKKEIHKTGEWIVPKTQNIGYLDQHYNNLDKELSVIEHIELQRPEWSHAECRNFLNSFLFRKNHEIHKKSTHLSGGEKARLSLAIIACKIPSLLILDEITNNLDLETKSHVIEILRDYPSSILTISHDKSFLEMIKIDEYYQIKNGTIT